jgi:hypothetical protein
MSVEYRYRRRGCGWWRRLRGQEVESLSHVTDDDGKEGYQSESSNTTCIGTNVNLRGTRGRVTEATGQN